MSRYRQRFAFTLVELLVVIAIIGVLVSLLLPAVNSAREAARVLQCKNHLRNIGLAAINHESTQGFYPSGGWAKEFTADPNRGFGKRQPGSWLYNILPYVEEQALHDLGDGLDYLDQQYTQLSEQRHQTPVGIYHCPSRRAATPYPHSWVACINSPTVTSLPKVAKNDYAANAGAGAVNAGDPPFMVPRNYAQADNPAYPWTVTDDDDPTGPNHATYCSGIVYYRSEVKIRHVKDGLSKTYFAGERYLKPESYDYSSPSFSDNQSMYTGFEWDNTRLTRFIDHPAYAAQNEQYLPQRDRSGYSNYDAFGSAHAGGVNMVMCDGAVLTVSTSTDGRIHGRLGDRKDGLTGGIEGL